MMVNATPMTDQEIVDHFARLAKSRLLELLKLNVPHLYDPRPGHAATRSDASGSDVGLKLVRSVQPYGDIHRFLSEEKTMGFVVNPGLVPLIKAIVFDARGRRMLVTRQIAARPDDKGVLAQIDGCGVRVMMYYDEDEGETHVVWECLYGVS
jgi:hypothetical protein